MQKLPVRLSILGTLAYSSIFEYPLSVEELSQRLMVHENSKVNLPLKLLDYPGVEQVGEWFVVETHKDQVNTRKKREYFSKMKKAEAKTIVSVLQRIPTISSAYITGSLSMQNVVSPADDIDLLIVTLPGTLWISRFIIVLWTSLIGKYRLHGTTGEWGWCFNLWLDQSHLEMPKEHRSLYSAYEVIQAKQILGTQNELLENNNWINEYINYSKSFRNTSISSTQKKHDTILKIFLRCFLLLFAKVFEKPSYFIQRLYMQPKRTTERVGKGFAFFHPRQTKKIILQKWQERLEEVGLKKNEIEQLLEFFEKGVRS